MRIETMPTALWMDEFRSQQKRLLDRTQQTDLTATVIREMVEQLPDLLQPEDSATTSLGERLMALLLAVETAIDQSTRQQAGLEKAIERWESKMTEQQDLMARQQQDLGKLLEALRGVD